MSNQCWWVVIIKQCYVQCMYVYIYIRVFLECGVPQNCYSIGKWSQPYAFWNFEITLFSAKPFFRIWSLLIQDEPKSPFGEHENSKPWWNQLPNCLLLEAPFLIVFCDGDGEPSEPLRDCLKQTSQAARPYPVGGSRPARRTMRGTSSFTHCGAPGPGHRRSVENRLRADAWTLRSLQKYQDGKVLLWAWTFRGLVKLHQDFAKSMLIGAINQYSLQIL